MSSIKGSACLRAQRLNHFATKSILRFAEQQLDPVVKCFDSKMVQICAKSIATVLMWTHKMRGRLSDSPQLPYLRT
jgi:hypothetical protein